MRFTAACLEAAFRPLFMWHICIMHSCQHHLSAYFHC